MIPRMTVESVTYAVARMSPQPLCSALTTMTKRRKKSTEDDDPGQLGRNIEQARIAAGYENAAEFARLIGVSPGTLGDWEGGRYRNLRLDNLLRIAKGAACNFDALVVGVDAAYDLLSLRPPDKEKPTPLTFPVIGAGVSSAKAEQQEPAAATGGDTRGSLVENRPSESGTTTSYLAALHGFKRLFDIADQLSGLSGDIRRIASGEPDPPTKQNSTERDQGHSDVRRATTARRKGRR